MRAEPGGDCVLTSAPTESARPVGVGVGGFSGRLGIGQKSPHPGRGGPAVSGASSNIANWCPAEPQPAPAGRRRPPHQLLPAATHHWRATCRCVRSRPTRAKDAGPTGRLYGAHLPALPENPAMLLGRCHRGAAVAAKKAPATGAGAWALHAEATGTRVGISRLTARRSLRFRCGSTSHRTARRWCAGAEWRLLDPMTFPDADHATTQGREEPGLIHRTR